MLALMLCEISHKAWPTTRQKQRRHETLFVLWLTPCQRGIGKLAERHHSQLTLCQALEEVPQDLHRGPV